MALDQKTREADRVYEDFEPPSDWDHDEGSATLILMLPGFKKEQLRVQVTSTRVLRVSGERQISENKWRRFRKEMPMPPDSDTTGISAKFEAGMLYVRLPKVIKNKQRNGPTPTQEAPKPQQPITTDQKLNNDQPRVLEDKAAESQKPVHQEPKAEKDYSQKKEEEEKEKEKEKGKAGLITDEDVKDKVAKERVEGAMASKVEDQTHDGIGKMSREGKMEKRSPTMEMLSRQSQEYLSALSSLGEEVKKEKKLINVLLVIFFVLLFVLVVKNAIKSAFSS